jgi:hypothetical protein
MRHSTPVQALLVLLVFGIRALAEDPHDKVSAQEKAAQDTWAAINAGDSASLESDHLRILAPKTMERRLKEISGNLERSFTLAVRALQINAKEELWPGKLTVYLIPEREKYSTFIRRIEKRRLDEEESGSQFVDNEVPHAVAGPPRAKSDPSLESQAAIQVAAALLQKKAGPKVPLPEWLLAGFGRATVWRALPADKAVVSERRLAKASIAGKKRTPADVWNNMVETSEAGVLRASLMEFLAYGPGAAKFPALVVGFRPGENQESRTIEQALESAGLESKVIEARWGPWALGSGK